VKALEGFVSGWVEAKREERKGTNGYKYPPLSQLAVTVTYRLKSRIIGWTGDHRLDW